MDNSLVSNSDKISGDFLLLWSLNKRTKEGKFLCDFTSQKVWIILWQIMNILGLLGLVISMGRWDLIWILSTIWRYFILGWYLVSLGFWSMLYDPIHFAVFMIIISLIPVLLYTAYILHGLYIMLGEAYIDVRITPVEQYLVIIFLFLVCVVKRQG